MANHFHGMVKIAGSDRWYYEGIIQEYIFDNN